MAAYSTETLLSWLADPATHPVVDGMVLRELARRGYPLAL